VVRFGELCGQDPLHSGNVQLDERRRERSHFGILGSEELSKRIIRVVSAVGNFGELYRAEVEDVFGFRSGANSLHTLSDDNGLLYSYPFGTTVKGNDLGLEGSSPTIAEIQERGFVKCGVILTQGFVTYDEITDTVSGFDAEYCRALSASLFIGDSEKVEFVMLEDNDAFLALSDAEIDVLTGQEVTLMNEFFESTTGHSFAFTEPYFWTDDFRSRALATRRDDDRWSSFVYWTLTAIVYAEENGIDSSSAIAMPPVSFFGGSLLQCFRDCIAAVGNYGEIYNRTIGGDVPRSGANRLNSVPYDHQQVGYPLV
jgi:hypothetical protein